MLCSGSSALHVVNPNLKKKKKEHYCYKTHTILMKKRAYPLLQRPHMYYPTILKIKSWSPFYDFSKLLPPINKGDWHYRQSMQIMKQHLQKHFILYFYVFSCLSYSNKNNKRQIHKYLLCSKRTLLWCCNIHLFSTTIYIYNIYNTYIIYIYIIYIYNIYI